MELDCTENNTLPRGPVKYIKRLKGIATRQVERSIDCQKAWDVFKSTRPYTTDAIKDGERKYRRLDFRFREHTPKLNSYRDLEYLESEAEHFCFENEGILQGISNKLVASLFYFKLEMVDAYTTNAAPRCKGKTCPPTLLPSREFPKHCKY